MAKHDVTVMLQLLLNILVKRLRCVDDRQPLR
jgi:hypothetical protein